MQDPYFHLTSKNTLSQKLFHYYNGWISIRVSDLRSQIFWKRGFLIKSCWNLTLKSYFNKVHYNFFINNQNFEITSKFFNKLRKNLNFHLFVILSGYNIWAFVVMKYIIYKQYAYTFNVVFWFYVMFYFILPQFSYSPCQIAPQNCLANI